jgi:DNA-directed RNA polymerase subunit RPC12/RpoP
VREDRMSIDINGELYHHNDDCTAECPRCHKAFQDLSEYDVWDNQKEIDCPHCGESIVLCCWVSIAYSTKLPNRTAGGEKP